MKTETFDINGNISRRKQSQTYRKTFIARQLNNKVGCADCPCHYPALRAPLLREGELAVAGSFRG